MESNKNDIALKQYFLRGMRRFTKHIRAQDFCDTPSREDIETRIEAAYQSARSQFQTDKENK